MMGMALEKLPDWPAAMTREEALAYSRVSEAQLRQWERAGKVRFRARGPKGAMIALRVDIEAALAAMFGDASEDMDFGD